MCSDGQCSNCGAVGYVERHHTVFRSQASYMKFIPCNTVLLCLDCHRGSKNGVHHNKETDLKLKSQLQNELFGMFSDKFIKGEEIQEKLKCTKIDSTLILKKLTMYRQGYEREQLVRRLLGGKLY